MNQNNKITGILLLLLYVCITTALLNANFIRPYNLQNLLRYISMFGVISIGAVFVIITGGIDLSMGSMVGLTGCIMTLTINDWGVLPAERNYAFIGKLLGSEMLLVGLGLGAWSSYESWRRKRGIAKRRLVTIFASGFAGVVLWIAAVAVGHIQMASWLTIPLCLALVMIVSVHLGLLHGVLITKLRLQPFVVTLCGLMCYRGLSRWLANDKPQGFLTTYDDSLRLLAIGKPCTANFVLLAAGIVIAAIGMVRMLFDLRNLRRPNWIWGLALLLVGGAMAVVGSSKYWNGWKMSYGDPIFSIAGVEIKTFGATVEKEARERPAELMKYAAYPFAVSVVSLLVISSLRTRSQKGGLGTWVRHVLLPPLLCTAGVVCLLLVKHWIGNEAVVFREVTWDKLSKFLCVCGAMALTMTGLYMWISSVARNGRVLERSLLLLTSVMAIMWLLSGTSIHNMNVQFPFFVMIVVAVLAGIFLRQTIFGRYLFALGCNEEATRYSGINTDRMIILAYVVCAACAGIGGILFTLDSNNVEPSAHGSFYELYAIAAAVLGGCSLRGGEGSIVGVILGASIMRVLFNAPNMIGVAQQLELFTMGIVILFGVITDEQLRRAAARRSRKLAA